MKKMKHPPKEKHATRPRREPVIPMSDEARAMTAESEYQKALIHLGEAEKIAGWGGAPNACVHSAYYAMHHCASAAILISGGVGKTKASPKSHTHVIEHFAKLVEKQSDELRECGKMLSRARTDRMTADYGLVEGVEQQDALETVDDAREFIRICRERWKFGAT